VVPLQLSFTPWLKLLVTPLRVPNVIDQLQNIWRKQGRSMQDINHFYSKCHFSCYRVGFSQLDATTTVMLRFPTKGKTRAKKKREMECKANAHMMRKIRVHNDYKISGGVLNSVNVGRSQTEFLFARAKDLMEKVICHYQGEVQSSSSVRHRDLQQATPKRL